MINHVTHTDVLPSAVHVAQNGGVCVLAERGQTEEAGGGDLAVDNFVCVWVCV